MSEFSFNEPTFACVSVRQPWADLLVADIKPIENRGWSCKYRGPIVIHAGKTWGRDEEDAYAELMTIAMKMQDDRRKTILYQSRERLGGIVGVQVMRGCTNETGWYARGGQYYDGVREWFVGPYGWQMSGGVMLPRVIPYRGQQGLFSVPRRAVPVRWEGDSWVSIS